MGPRRRILLRRLVAPGVTIALVLLGSAAALGASTPGRTAPAQDPSCDPNYSGACVPVGAASVTCADLAPATDILVVGQDIYALDRGGAGRVACESSGADTAPGAVGVPAPAGDAEGALPEEASTPGATMAGMPDTAAPATVAGATATNGELARTGRTTVPLLVASLLLLLLGGGLMALGRPDPEWYAGQAQADVRFTVRRAGR